LVGRLPEQPAGGGFDPAAGHLFGELQQKGKPMPTSVDALDPERKPSLGNVRVLTREDRERAAFRRLTLAIGALLQRGERDAANDALRRWVKRGERDE